MVAVLFLGLPDTARTKKVITKNTLSLEQTLLAMAVDGINVLLWSKSKDGQKGRNRPKSILDMLRGYKEEKECEAFSTPQELMDYFESIEKGEKNG